MNPGQRLFPHTMDVYDGLYTSVNSAGAKRTEALRQANVACRIEDARSDQQLVNLALGAKVTHRIFTLYAGVQNGDTCHAEGSIYQVVSISSRRALGNMDDFVTLEAVEILA